MLFLIVLIALLISIGVAFGAYKKERGFYAPNAWDHCYDAFMLISIVLAGILAIMLAYIISAKMETPAKTVELNEWRTSIEFKVDSELYLDEWNLLDKDIVDEIRNYNSTIQIAQTYRANPWVSIFYSSAYDGLEPIDYNVVASEREFS